MKKIFLLLLTNSFLIHSQVGINTTNPQQMLHVAGSNETIRVDGLNAFNNPLNNGIATPVSVNANGDLVLEPTTKFSLDIVDIIPTPTVLNSNDGSYVTNNNLGSTNIVLTKSSLVCINYNLTVSQIQESGGGIIRDGKPRLLHGFIVVNGQRYAYSSNIYSSYHGSILGGGTVAVGIFYLNGTHYMNLPAGTHTVSIGGGVFGGSHAFQAEFGTVQDTLQVLILD